MFIPDPDFLPIPDPGVKKATGFGSATLATVNKSIFIVFFAACKEPEIFLSVRRILGRPPSVQSHFPLCNTRGKMLQGSKIIQNAASRSQAIVRGNGDKKKSPVVGVLDEPYSAKPAQRSSHT